MSTSTRPAPKPARSPRQMAAGERLRQISEQADALYPRLFDALSRHHEKTAHHIIDRLLTLADEHADVMDAMQDEAETPWSRAA